MTYLMSVQTWCNLLYNKTQKASACPCPGRMRGQLPTDNACNYWKLRNQRSWFWQRWGPKVRSRVWGNCLLAWLLCTLDSQIHFPSTYDLRGCREAELSGQRVWGECHPLRMQRGQGRVECCAWGWRKRFRRWQDPTVDGRLWQSNLSIWQMSTAVMLWMCWTQYGSQLGKLSSDHKTGKEQFSFQSQRRSMSKHVQTTAELHSFHMLAK